MIPNPFRGPHPLTRDNRIFGRDREIASLRALLVSERFVLLHSPSGAGKSSLINAGLIPEVKDRFDVWEPARVNAQPPPDAPNVNRYIWSVLASWQRPGQYSTLLEFVLAQARASKILVIFDQFEEILRATPAEVPAQSEFFRQLAELLSHPRVWALFAVREDYLAPLLPFLPQLPTHLRTRCRLDLLTRAQASEAMAGTAAEGGRSFRDSALSALTANLAAVRVQNPDGSVHPQPIPGEHVEPMHLQVVCHRLWNSMPDHDSIIDPEDVAAFGDVTKALSDYYDAALFSLFGNDKVWGRAVREWFQEKLIAGHSRAQVRAGAQDASGLPAACVEPLLKTYLVRAETHPDGVWLELAHDRLIEPVTLANQAWFRDNLVEVQRRASEWLKQNRLDGLLLEDAALVEAHAWAAANPSLVTPAERELLTTSSARQSTLWLDKKQKRRLLLWRFVAIGCSLVLLLQFPGNLRSFRAGSTAAAHASRLAAERQRLNTRARQLEIHNYAWSRAAFSRVQLAVENNQTALALAHLARILRSQPDPEAARSWTALLLLQANPAAIASPILPLSSPPRFITCSHDGRLAFLISTDGKPILWNTISDQQIQLPVEGNELLTQGTFTPSGRSLLTTATGGTLTLWDTSTGARRFNTHVSLAAAGDAGAIGGDHPKVFSFAFNPDESAFAVASWAAVEILSASTGARVNFISQPNVVNDVKYSSDGESLITAASDNKAYLNSLSAAGSSRTDFATHEGPVTFVAIHPSNSFAVTTSVDRTARLTSMFGGLVGFSMAEIPSAFSAKPLHHEDAVSKAHFAAGGRDLVTITANGTLQRWAIESGEKLGPAVRFPADPLSYDLSHSTLRHVAVTPDGTAQLFATPYEVPIGPPFRMDSPITQAQFSADGRFLLTASAKSVRLWPILIDSDTPELLADLAESVAGLTLDAAGNPIPLPDRAERLQQLRLRANGSLKNFIPQ